MTQGLRHLTQGQLLVSQQSAATASGLPFSNTMSTLDGQEKNQSQNEHRFTNSRLASTIRPTFTISQGGRTTWTLVDPSLTAEIRGTYASGSTCT